MRLLVLSSIFLFSALIARTQNNRVAIVDTEVFYDQKSGIVRLNKVMDALNAEFKPMLDALQAKESRLSKLSDDLRTYSGSDRNKKQEEAEKLQRDLQFEREDIKSRYQRREQAVVDPVRTDIGNALNDFAKQKGFTAVFDISKDTGGFLLWVDQDAVNNPTNEFIRFYNARPAK